MSNYVTTNIRIPEEDYIRLKEEAAEKRQSLSAVIREKITTEDHTANAVIVEKFMDGLEKIAGHNAKKLKHWDSLKALRQTRDEN